MEFDNRLLLELTAIFMDVDVLHVIINKMVARWQENDEMGHIFQQYVYMQKHDLTVLNSNTIPISKTI